MNIGYKCTKYKLDAWGMCKYKIHYEIEDCENNCALEMDKLLLKEKLICKKDWILNGKIGYTKGKEYEIIDKEINNHFNSILIKADGCNFEGWFHSGSDYFDVDLLF